MKNNLKTESVLQKNMIGITRLIHRIIRFIHGTTRLIYGLARLIDGWGARPGIGDRPRGGDGRVGGGRPWALAIN